MNEVINQHAVGSVRISKEVLATIASNAAREVIGIAGLAEAPVDFKGLLTRGKLPRSVSVCLVDDLAEIELFLLVKSEAKIPVVSQKVQSAVKEAVQSMTGITVSKVNVTIAGVVFGDSVDADKE